MFRKKFLFLGVFLTACSSTTNQMLLQDTEAAVKFFEDEMNFKTNAHGVKEVLFSKNVTIVDVRDEQSYQKGHIPGAINIPVNKYKFDGTEKTFPGLRKDRFNYVYCYTHYCNLGTKAAKAFASAGYPVKEIQGGFDAWQEENKGGVN